MERTFHAGELADRLSGTGDSLDVLELATAVLVRNFELLRRRGGVYAELDQSEYLILRILDGLGPADIGTLAGSLRLDPSTAGRQVSALLGKGLVERGPAPDDRRRSIITPTETGRERMHQTRARRRGSMADLMGDWTAEDQEAFADLLTRYNRAVAGRYLAGAR
ncbi:MarR family winged helix-turn-helix transcriptional regulator [Amycolatopsis jiangsuensis]|uniref:DNA-binding MarR family transcriptional regulator n=1 Tax=Amycolatopsis jiangsuensis TaxID=1181879 RepID=A0A840IQC8_9PSEU|nr:MarR family transcriptional regulator [Amycolatopsis jiangsuensis]MBB4683402.1 DNA-binding MarR family transcriptional regulator [Amycolatopsis jiangsuensis]